MYTKKNGDTGHKALMPGVICCIALLARSAGTNMQKMAWKLAWKLE